MQQEREIYNLIQNDIYSSVFITDKSGEVLYVNSACEKLLGQSSKELCGINVRKLVNKKVYNRSTVLECIKTGDVIVDTLRTKNGGKILAISSIIYDNTGSAVATVTNSFDTNIIEKFTEILKNEKKKTKRYKNAIDYIMGVQSDSDLIIKSPITNALFKNAYKVAHAECSVIVFGESGVGKEVLVRYLHQNSARSDEPLIPVNCAAIPKDLMESEFFGYEKGAFTSANEKGKLGLFELANHGIIFLDEIAELPLELQSKLLRVLETKKVLRLGSTIYKDVDFRLIAATNKNLLKMVHDGSFRQDLYYRLNVIPLYVPPLRERIEDIPALVNLFLKKFNKKYGKTRIFTAKEMESFSTYSWPGNIRELQNVIERIIITDASALEILNLDRLRHVQNIEILNRNLSLKEYNDKTEWIYIQKTLNDCNGQVSKAAQKLGIHRTVLYKKIAHYKSIDNKITYEIKI